MKGIGASPGIAIAKAFVLKHEELIINTDKTKDINGELVRLEAAVNESRKQLEAIKEKAIVELGEEEAQIFGAHLMVLDDPEYIGQVKVNIENNNMTADHGLKTVTDQFVSIFETMEDAYLKERAADIKDVGTRILRNILGVKASDLGSINEDSIIIAYDLTPSDTAQMNKEKVLGFATDIGGRTSHTAIMARSLEIPAVLGLGSVTEQVKDGDIVIVDGIEGKVVVNPSEELLEEYKGKKKAYEDFRAELGELKELSAETKDAHKVELAGNIGTPNDVDGVLKNGGEGVGLYRTEFLYMDSETMPSEDKQFEAYKKVLEDMGGKPVIIRTLDIGGDKKLPYLELAEEMNPFLGLRAVRLCLQEKDMFKTQLKAILRASIYGQALVMFPMISSIQEVRQAKAVIEECKRELDVKGIKYDKELKVGIMVEIPAAAIAADIIAKEVDFFSIGTNDLCQYTLAVDRMNEKVSYLYDPLHPAIIRLVKNVIDASHKEGIFTGMCGEMAGDPYSALILLGLGLDEFSMSALSIPQIKKIIRSVTMVKAKEIAEKALTLSTAEEVKELVDKELENLDIKII